MKDEEIFFITLSNNSYTRLSDSIINQLSSLRSEGLLQSFQIHYKTDVNQLWITLFEISGDVEKIKKIYYI